MGGGAPLAFLNKKTWHPGRFQNQEEVWKREQAAAAEQRKLEELRKQYEDERKDAEFTQMAEDAGFTKDSRLDWMYAGSLAAKHEAQARQDAAAAGSSAAAAAAAAAGVPTALEKQQQQQEAPLMGKQPAPDEHLSRAEQASRLPSFLAAGAPTSQNEQWARMTNDPLLAIKQQEQEALKRVKHNPIKMQQILKEVEKVRSHKHKKERKEKKEKKEHRKEHGSRKRSRSRSRSLSPPPRMLPPAHRGPQPDSRDERGAQYASRHESSRGRYDSSSRDARQDDRSARGHAGRDREDLGRSHRQRSRSRSRSRDRHDRQRGSSDNRHKQDPDRAGGRGRDEAPRQHTHHSSGSHHHHHNGGGGGSSREGEKRAGYGLDATRAHAAGGSAMASEAAARAEATRQRLAEAAAAKEAAVAAERAARGGQQRESYRAGKLSADEKAARLAAMMGNADEHEAQRRERLAKARAEEDAERQAGVSRLLAKAAAVRAEDAFKSAAAAEVFGSMSAGGGMGLDARINSRRHYNQH